MTAATVQDTPGSPLKSASTKMIAVIAVVVFIALVAVGAYLRSSGGVPDFLQNQTVSAMGEIRLDFPEAMNHDSVMEHLALPDGLSADSRWDGESLVFKPKQQWVANETYVFTLDKKALTAAGQPLGKDMEFTYKITGAPTLSAQVPVANSLGVDSQTRIALVFDRPMVALSQVQGKAYDQKMAAWPVKVTPDVPGRWRWLGTTTAEFTPDKPFPLATQYTVTVPVGIQTAHGEKTDKDFSWTFETVRPEFTGSEPGEGTDTSGPKTQIVLHFNQNIDLESVKQHVSVMRDFSSAERRGEARKTQDASAPGGLTVAPGETLTMKSIVYGTTTGADKKKVIDKTTVVLIPAAPLVLNSSYSVTLKAGIVGIEGNLGTNDQRSYTFSTVGPLRVVSHDTQDNNRIHIAFSNPMVGATIKKNLVIKPELEGWKDMELGTNDWDGNKDVYIYGPFKPSTTYKVTVLASMTDREDQKLEGGPVEFSFTTPQVAPEVFIHSNGEFGIFEKGKPPVYYLNGVNVSKFTLELGHLTLENFLRIRSEQRANSSQLPHLGREPETEA
jgi:Bacterial Ig-like domain